MTPTQITELRETFIMFIERMNLHSLDEVGPNTAAKILDWFIDNLPKEEVKQEPTGWRMRPNGYTIYSKSEKQDILKASSIPVSESDFEAVYTHPVKEDKDFVLLPRKLTAENGHKGLLSGEFNEIICVPNTSYCGCGNCDFCEMFPDHDEHEERKIPVSWTTIKEIYNTVVNFHYPLPEQPKI